MILICSYIWELLIEGDIRLGNECFDLYNFIIFRVGVEDVDVKVKIWLYRRKLFLVICF